MTDRNAALLFLLGHINLWEAVLIDMGSLVVVIFSGMIPTLGDFPKSIWGESDELSPQSHSEVTSLAVDHGTARSVELQRTAATREGRDDSMTKNNNV